MGAMRLRVGVVVVAMVGLAYWAGLFATVEAGEPTTPSSSSGGCLPPTLGADLFTFGYPSSLGSDATLGEDCETLCRSHVRKCVRISRVARTCNANTVGAMTGLLQDVCGTDEDAHDRTQCDRQARALKTELRRCVGDDFDSARACCERYRADCVATCVTGSFAAPDPPCFTGDSSCLFNLFNATLVR